MDALEYESLGLRRLPWASRKTVVRYRLVTWLQSLGYHQALQESCRASWEEYMPLLCRAISIELVSKFNLLTYDEPSRLGTRAPSPLWDLCYPKLSDPL